MINTFWNPSLFRVCFTDHGNGWRLYR